MNLHLTHDSVFIDYIINAGNALGLKGNKYLIHTLDGKRPKMVKSEEIHFAKYDSPEFWKIIGDIRQYKTLYIHFMHGITSDFVNRMPAGLKIVWCFWGGDGLELPSMLKNVYQPKSFRYFRKHDKLSWKPLSLRKIYYNYLAVKQRKKVDEDNVKAIARVNYFAHYLPEDFMLIKKATTCNAAFVPFHYAAFEDIVPAHMKKTVAAGNNILLGNSDTVTNNHFEAIDQLAETGLNGAKVYCPLSYEGGQYAKDVAAYGKKKLGDDFIPMLQYLPKEEYDKMLSGISVSLMNHNRSQALGNILGLLCGGVKLYMSADSTLYQFFKKHGLHVFSIQHDLSAESMEKKLKAEEVKFNQDKLVEIFGKAHHLEKIKNLLAL
jgi:hypothetical protein